MEVFKATTAMLPHSTKRQ